MYKLIWVILGIEKQLNTGVLFKLGDGPKQESVKNP